MKHMGIKAAIFDMDGTLVDSLMLWDVMWREFGLRYLGDREFRPNEADQKAVRTLTLKDAMELIHSHYAVAETGQVLLDCANRIISDFYGEKLEAKKGARQLLEQLRDAGVKMCIASATAPDLIELALEHCGLRQFFLEIFSCSVLGKGKEEPDLYLLAQGFLGEAVSDTWVFEDSLTAIETAVKIGLPTVGIYDRFNHGQEQIQRLVNIYVGPGESLADIPERML